MGATTTGQRTQPGKDQTTSEAQISRPTRFSLFGSLEIQFTAKKGI